MPNNNILNSADQVYIKESTREIYITRRGFAGIYRDSFENLEGAQYSLFAYILLHCNFQDNPNFTFDSHTFPLRRGQFVTSLNKLNKATGLSVQQIRTCLRNLNNLKILTDQSTDILTKRARLITVINIDKYLVRQEELTELPTKKVTVPQQSPNKALTIINKDNKEKNDIQIINTHTSDDVLAVWNDFCEKTGKSKQYTLTDKRRTWIKRILKAHEVDDCKNVNSKFSQDQWWIDKGLNDIKHVYKDLETFESWLVRGTSKKAEFAQVDLSQYN